MNEMLVTCTALHKRYGNKPALNGVNLDAVHRSSG